MSRLIFVYLIFTLFVLSQSRSENIAGPYQIKKVVENIEIFMSYSFYKNGLVTWEYYSKILEEEVSSFKLKGTYQIKGKYIKVYFLNDNEAIEDKFEIMSEELLKGSDGLLFEKKEHP